MSLSHDKPAIYYFSSIDFDFLLQRPQQLYHAFREQTDAGFEFFYIQPRRRKRKDLPKTPPAENVLTGCFNIPFRNSRSGPLEVLNQYFRSKTIQSICTHSGPKIAIISTSAWEPYISKQDFDFICYDYLDSLEVFAKPKHLKRMQRYHRYLVEKSDLVFVTAQKLLEEIQSECPEQKTVLVSNGVDTDFFQSQAAQVEQVTDYWRTSRKVVGYVGALYQWLDLPLVIHAANVLSDLDFVLIGPLCPEYESLIQRAPENIHWLGPKPYHTIPAYMNLFDVALIPFKSGHVAESTNPIKLYEYFSLGKPVVATHMRELQRFDDGKLLKIASERLDFIKAIQGFLQYDDHSWQAKRQSIALENSWQSKTQIMINSLEELLSSNPDLTIPALTATHTAP